MRLLLVEDDPALGDELARMLRKAGFAVDRAETAAQALDAGYVEPYDAAVLDLGLPDGDGLDVLAAWRREKRTFPVLILTARDRFANLVAAFKGGADDFLAKPFRNEELVLRLNALIRRAAGDGMGAIAVGELTLEPATGEIAASGLPLKLTAFERRMLRYLMLAGRRVVGRGELSDHLYEGGTDRDFNSLEVIVSRLRRKIAPARIASVRGEGYRLEAADAG